MRTRLRDNAPAWTRQAPSHLVLLEEADDKNIETLCNALKIRERKGGDLLPWVEFEPNEPGRRSAVLFRRQKLAAVQLNPDEEIQLRAQKGVVRDIVPNGSCTLGNNGGTGAGGLAALPEDWHVQRVGASGAAPTGQGVKVAVLDTGVDQQHPDFVGRIAASVNYVGAESMDDENGHGTFCAGLIAGHRTGGGTRYCISPGVSLLVAKVLNRQGDGSDDIIMQGIEWAAQQGARIISMSFGSRRETGTPASAAYEHIAQRLFNETPGILLLAAGGNDSDRLAGRRVAIRNPAACQSICSVVAVDASDAIANNSNADVDGIGEVNFSAPGVRVFSASAGPIYMRDSGTSTATPIAAGIAALLLEQNPGITARQLKALMESGAASKRAPGQLAVDYGAGVVHL